MIKYVIACLSSSYLGSSAVQLTAAQWVLDTHTKPDQLPENKQTTKLPTEALLSGI